MLCSLKSPALSRGSASPRLHLLVYPSLESDEDSPVFKSRSKKRKGSDDAPYSPTGSAGAGVGGLPAGDRPLTYIVWMSSPRGVSLHLAWGGGLSLPSVWPLPAVTRLAGVGPLPEL